MQLNDSGPCRFNNPLYSPDNDKCFYLYNTSNNRLETRDPCCSLTEDILGALDGRLEEPLADLRSAAVDKDVRRSAVDDICAAFKRLIEALGLGQIGLEKFHPVCSTWNGLTRYCMGQHACQQTVWYKWPFRKSVPSLGLSFQ